jgi:hypothetical protein
MTDKFLTEEEVRKLDSERTQGDWYISDPGQNIIQSTNGEFVVADGTCFTASNDEDSRFIAATPQIVKQYLDLLEEHNRYQAESCKSAFEKGKAYGELYKRYSELEQENRELVQKVHELEEDRKHNVLIEKIIALKQENQRYQRGFGVLC